MTSRQHRRALYFGSLGDGHVLYGLARSTTDPQRDCPGFPWTPHNIDGGLLENRGVPDHPDGRVYWTCGRASDGLWLAFFWWDRSKDPRGASNSGFYVQGFAFEDREAAFAYACSRWPQVVSRQEYSLRLQP